MKFVGNALLPSPSEIAGQHMDRSGIAPVLSKLAFLCALVGIFVTPFSGYRVPFRGAALSDVMFLLSLLLTGYVLLVSRALVWLPIKLLLGGLITFFGLLIYDFVGGGVIGRDPYAIPLIAGWFLIPVIIVNQVVYHPGRITWLLRTWMAGVALGAAVGILHYHRLVPPEMMPYGELLSSRAPGLTSHPNAFGLYCALGFPLFLEVALAEPSKVKRLSAAIICLGLIYAINISGSRGAILLILLGFSLTCMLLVLRGHLSYATVTTILIVVVMALLAFVVVGDVRTAHGDSALERLFIRSGSAEWADLVRDRWRDVVWKEFLKYPFLGNGYNNRGVHDFLYGTLAMGGIVGLIGQLLREWAAVDDLRRLNLLRRSIALTLPMSIGASVSYLVWLASLTQGYWLLERGGMVVIGLLGSLSYVLILNSVPSSLQGQQRTSE